jgi:trk system potassium uptake protein TrkA
MRTIARVNNPKNVIMFKNLGIDNTVCSTEVIANLIEYSLNKEDYRIVNTLGRGIMLLAELSVKEDGPWSGKMIKDLILPLECVFVSVLRGDDVIYPKGDTQILCNDKVLIVTNNIALSDLVAELYDGGNKRWKSRKMK